MALLAVLGCTVGLGLLSFAQLRLLDATAAKLRRELMPGGQAAGRLAFATERFRGDQAMLLLDIPDTSQAVIVAAFAVRRREIRADLDVLRQVLRTDYAIRAVDRIERDWQAYLDLSATFDELAASRSLAPAGRLLSAGMALAMQAVRYDVSELTNHLVFTSNLMPRYGKETGDATRDLILEAIGLALLVLAFTGWVLNRRLVRPLMLLTQAVRRMAEGDIDAPLPGARRQDEIGAMTAALAVFQHAMTEERRLAHRQAGLAQADKARVERVSRLALSFEATVDAFSAEIGAAAVQLHQTAGLLNASAVAVIGQTEMARDHAAQANGDAVSSARRAEELSGSIGEIRRQAEESAVIAGTASQAAQRTTGTVAALAEGARAIGHIVSLIDAIAAKTRLLALNATIEAASAGEAGRGFAVVAGEVKSLAVQTKHATEEIGSHIRRMQSATTDAVQAIAGVVQVIGRTSDLSTLTANEAEQQERVVRDISRSVQRASLRTRKVDEVIGLLTQQTSGTGGAASQVLDAASALSRQIDQLNRQVGCFLTDLRAA